MSEDEPPILREFLVVCASGVVAVFGTHLDMTGSTFWGLTLCSVGMVCGLTAALVAAVKYGRI